MFKFIIAILIAGLFFGMAQSCEEQQSILVQQAFDYNMGNPAEPGSWYPSIVADAQGHVGMSWTMNVGEDLHAIQVAMLSPEGWSSPSTVTVAPDLFVNWADYPTLATWEGEPVAVHWLKKRPSENPYAYDIQVAFYEGGEPARWSSPITPHTDDTDTEHGFVSMHALSKDEILMIWLDGREMAGHHESEEEVSATIDVDRLERVGHGETHFGKDGFYAYHEEHGTGAMTLRSAIIHRDGSMRQEQVIDKMVCECCPTDLVPTSDGFMVIYRNRTEQEVRDIWVSFYDLGTHRWSDPEPVAVDNWIIGGCPVNGPAAARSGDHLGVAWYTEADSTRKLQFALREADGFGAPLVVGEGRSIVGRVSLTANETGTFYATWLEYLPLDRDESGKLAVVNMAEITVKESLEGESGMMLATMGDVKELGVVENRRSGFPEVRYTNGDVFVAWTQTDPRPIVKTLRVPVGQNR